ncbi:MAG: hypothetical protein PWQ39_1422 [Thermacetogenium sp.]|jgi:hypothetical protein|nr:hypothetical protein [Thermacetogenium sp.]
MVEFHTGGDPHLEVSPRARYPIEKGPAVKRQL